jgi:hypothetical protein
MKTIIFMFVALGLASVLAVPVPQTPALTRRNFCDDELDIRDCALVRRGDSGEEDDVSSPDLAVVDPKRAAKDRRNQRLRAKRASESPETAKNRRATETARKRRRFEQLAVENSEAARRRKDRQSLAVQISRAARLASESPETAKNRRAMEAATKRRRRKQLAVENPEKFKLQKDRKAFLRKATRDAHRASQKASAQDPRHADNQRAHRAAEKTRYLAKKATQSLVTDPAGPSPPPGSPAAHWENVNPQRYFPGPQVVQHTHQVEPDHEDYAHLWLFEHHDTPPTSPLW